MTLAVIVPMRGRPHRVAPLLETLYATCKPTVLFAIDPNDQAVARAIDAVRADRFDVIWRKRGDYARKINEGIARTTAEHLFLAADDLAFHPGWYEAAAALLDGPIGVVGTNDICNPRTMRGDHATHCLVARWYSELGTIDGQPGLLHEGYRHEYVDDELVGTAKHRRAWAFAADSIVEHLHPLASKAPMDDQYAAQGMRMRASRAEFDRRRQLWT